MAGLLTLLRRSGAIVLLAPALAVAATADPTAPPPGLGSGKAPAVTEAPLRLEAILHGHERAHAALIDGELHKQGDTVRGMKLIRIDADRVILRGSQGRVTLRLIDAVDKRPSRIRESK